jgi:hypothetical protein
VPQCGETFQLKELSKYLKTEFENMQIQCDEDDCLQVYSFNDTVAHRLICSVKKIPCIYNCGDGQLYKGVEAMLAHVTEHCMKAKVICLRCRTKGAREAFAGHSCVLGFINQVKTGDADSYKTALSEMQA